MLISEIFEKVKVENALSKEKYGPWSDLSSNKHYGAIQSEFREWKSAFVECDTHGEHGEICELIDLINVACRRIQFLTGEADA
jgi:hypothetical protein